jgi:hypothetical protein
LMVWALLTLNASLYPENQTYIQIAPAYADNELKISFQFPLDSQALSLNRYQYIAASKRIVNQYLALDTGAVAQIGLDAYAVAVAEGFLGTRAEWLASLVGPAGPQGSQGIQGIQGDPGISAYEVAVAGGFVGTEAEWLASLIGETGLQGAQGIQGIQGDPGISAYEVAVAGGFVGTEAEWLASLIGETGPQGEQGIQGIQGVPGPQATGVYDGGDAFTSATAYYVLNLDFGGAA